MPTVSINTPVYNCEKYLPQTLDSILAQTYQDWECVIVDDASTDGTAAVALEYASRDPRFRVVQLMPEEKKPYPASRNVALKHSTGKWIAPLDGDDWWEPWKLEKQVALVESRPDIVLCLGAAWIWSAGEIVGTISTCPADQIERILSIYNISAHSSTMIDRQAMMEVNGYQEHMKIADDWDLWLRLMWRFGAKRITSFEKPVLYYRWHENNLTKSGGQNSYEWLMVRTILRHHGWGLKNPAKAWRIVDHWLVQDSVTFLKNNQYSTALKRNLLSILMRPYSRWRWKQLMNICSQWRNAQSENKTPSTPPA